MPLAVLARYLTDTAGQEYPPDTMIVRVRGVEIVCESLEELDQIIQRYGVEGAVRDGTGSIAVPSGGTAGAGGIDVKLLRQFVQNPAGIPSPTVAGMLKATGKGIPGALTAFAARMHLAPDSFEKCNPGGRRGWKLTEPALAAAQAVLSD